MGRQLFEQYDIAKELFAKADEALGFSLSQICFDGPADKLTLTEITQPAILTVSTICFRLAQMQPQASAHTIIAAAGHSLGEYSALVAADAMSFEDAVRLVNKRGRYMQEAVPVGTGRMVAVLGKEVAELQAAIDANTVAGFQSTSASGCGIGSPR
jgi:[acyl-carrier-protein] S-malonyltransferase